MQKFVIRLLDASNTLLAWAEVYAEPRPQGRGRSCPFWASKPTQFVIEQDGIASKLTVHWCDLDLARECRPLEPVQVRVGQVFTFGWMEPVWLVPTSGQDVPLPPVTIRQSVAVSPPTGNLLAVAQ